MQRFILTAALFAGLAFAQDLSQISSLPPCGQTCINNMFGKAASLGCATSDYACLCKNMNFGFGVRDCSIAVCAAANPPVDPTQAINVGNSFCAQVASASAGTGSTTTVAQTVLTGTTAVSAGGAAAGVITTTDSQGSTYTTTTGAAAATGSSGNGTVSSGGTGTNGTSSTNGTSPGFGGGKVVTTTNSLGSTITTTLASSTSGSSPSSSPSSSSSSSSSSSTSASSSSASGSGTSTGASTSPSATKKSEAGHVAAGAFVGLAGLAAWALL